MTFFNPIAVKSFRTVVCLLLWLPAILFAQTSADSLQPLELRLDEQISGTSSSAPELSSGTLLHFGRSDLQRRLDQSRQHTQLLKLENVHIEREIAVNETLIKRLQQLSDSQGQSSSAVQEIIRLGRRPPAPAKTVIPEARVKIVHLATGALPMNQALVSGVDDWMLLAGLGSVIVLLLFWILRLYAQNRSTRVEATLLGQSFHNQSQKTGQASRKQVQTSHQQESRAQVQPVTVSADESPAHKPESVASVAAVKQSAATGVLKEVDTLIAFEQFEQAQEYLQKLLVQEPKNPEYLLRHYHLCSVSEDEAEDEDEALLRALMDGPLSATLLRVKEMGQSMMPGDPLFRDDQSRNEALQVMNDAARKVEVKDEAEQTGDFNSTIIITPGADGKSM